MTLKKSTKPVRFYNKGTLCHTIKELQADGETIIVYKWWSRQKKAWQYEVFPERFYNLYIKIGTITIGEKNPIFKKQKINFNH